MTPLIRRIKATKAEKRIIKLSPDKRINFLLGVALKNMVSLGKRLEARGKCNRI